MEEELTKPAEPPVTGAVPGPAQAVEVTYAAIADRVRADSINGARLTRLEAIAPLTPEPEKLQALVRGMTSAQGYEDIHLLLAAHGDRYLYSDKAFTRQQAERFAFGDEVRSRIAAQVRDDSSKTVKLTPVGALGTLIPGAEPDKIDAHLTLLLSDEVYGDVRLITNGKGVRFLYSEASMTRTYAEILARAEAKDPCETLAATIRDDSRIYPRPTRLEIFNAPVFGIDPDDLDRLVREVANRPQYKDIKLVKASTGAVYLYSDLYLGADWVTATVEWEEVGKYQNP